MSQFSTGAKRLHPHSSQTTFEDACLARSIDDYWKTSQVERTRGRFKKIVHSFFDSQDTQAARALFTSREWLKEWLSQEGGYDPGMLMGRQNDIVRLMRNKDRTRRRELYGFLRELITQRHIPGAETAALRWMAAELARCDSMIRRDMESL